MKLSHFSYLIVHFSFLIGAAGLHAQNNQVSGTVVDASSGKALPGVNILVKGTTTATSTNVEGTFELNVSSLSDTLVVSYIGYLTQEVPINDRSVVDVQLQSEAVAGEELVVVGYGTTQKSDLTGSISNVEEGTVTSTPATSND